MCGVCVQFTLIVKSLCTFGLICSLFMVPFVEMAPTIMQTPKRMLEEEKPKWTDNGIHDLFPHKKVYSRKKVVGGGESKSQSVCNANAVQSLCIQTKPIPLSVSVSVSVCLSSYDVESQMTFCHFSTNITFMVVNSVFLLSSTHNFRLLFIPGWLS